AGAGGCMYHDGIEWILGFQLRGTELRLNPCIPATWQGYEIRFRYHTTTFEIIVDNPHSVSSGIASTELDGHVLPSASVELRDDGMTHRIRVVLGSFPPREADGRACIPGCHQQRRRGLVARPREVERGRHRVISVAKACTVAQCHCRLATSCSPRSMHASGSAFPQHRRAPIRTTSHS